MVRRLSKKSRAYNLLRNHADILGIPKTGVFDVSVADQDEYRQSWNYREHEKKATSDVDLIQPQIESKTGVPEAHPNTWLVSKFPPKSTFALEGDGIMTSLVEEVERLRGSKPFIFLPKTLTEATPTFNPIFFPAIGSKLDMRSSGRAIKCALQSQGIGYEKTLYRIKRIKLWSNPIGICGIQVQYHHHTTSDNTISPKAVDLINHICAPSSLTLEDGDYFLQMSIRKKLKFLQYVRLESKLGRVIEAGFSVGERERGYPIQNNNFAEIIGFSGYWVLPVRIDFVIPEYNYVYMLGALDPVYSPLSMKTSEDFGNINWPEKVKDDTENKPPNCYAECGGNYGSCENFCGKNGYCCDGRNHGKDCTSSSTREGQNFNLIFDPNDEYPRCYWKPVECAFLQGRYQSDEPGLPELYLEQNGCEGRILRKDTSGVYVTDSGTGTSTGYGNFTIHNWNHITLDSNGITGRIVANSDKDNRVKVKCNGGKTVVENYDPKSSSAARINQIPKTLRDRISTNYQFQDQMSGTESELIPQRKIEWSTGFNFVEDLVGGTGSISIMNFEYCEAQYVKQETEGEEIIKIVKYDRSSSRHYGNSRNSDELLTITNLEHRYDSSC